MNGPDVDIGTNDGNPNPSDFTKFPVVVTTGDTQILVNIIRGKCYIKTNEVSLKSFCLFYKNESCSCADCPI